LVLRVQTRHYIVAADIADPLKATRATSHFELEPAHLVRHRAGLTRRCDPRSQVVGRPGRPTRTRGSAPVQGQSRLHSFQVPGPVHSLLSCAMNSSFDWLWPPTPSTSALPEPTTWLPADASPASGSGSSSAGRSHGSPADSSGAGAGAGAVTPKKRMSCATCRNSKMKCVWLGEAEACVGCSKRGLR